MSTAETALCLDLGEEAVKVRLHHSRSLLRKDIYAQTGAATASPFQFLGARCDRMMAAVFEIIKSLPGFDLQGRRVLHLNSELRCRTLRA